MAAYRFTVWSCGYRYESGHGQRRPSSGAELQPPHGAQMAGMPQLGDDETHTHMHARTHANKPPPNTHTHIHTYTHSHRHTDTLWTETSAMTLTDR